MKYRVERARLDHGYGNGWVVLDELGGLAWTDTSYARAIRAARLLIAVWCTP